MPSDTAVKNITDTPLGPALRKIVAMVSRLVIIST